MAMSPEFREARANVCDVELVGEPNEVALAKAILLIIQHLEKRD